MSDLKLDILPGLKSGASSRRECEVINGKLVVGGVEAACRDCVFNVRNPNGVDSMTARICVASARPSGGVLLPEYRFCGEFLPREPKEEGK